MTPPQAARRNSFSGPWSSPDSGVWAWSVGFQIRVCSSSTSRGARAGRNVRVGQESAGIRPRRLVRGGYPDRLIPLLEVVSGADQLPIERLIEALLLPLPRYAKTSSPGSTSVTALVAPPVAALAGIP